MTQEEIDQLEASHAKCPICQHVFRSVDIMKVHLRRHDQTEAVTSGGNSTLETGSEDAAAALQGDADESKLKVDEDMDEEMEEEEEEEEEQQVDSQS